MSGKLPLPKSDQEFITVEEVYARWSKLQSLTVIQFCRLMNGYHQDQDLELYPREVKTNLKHGNWTDKEIVSGKAVGDEWTNGEFRNWILEPYIPLKAVNNKEKQNAHERIYANKLESIIEDWEMASSNKEYKEVERLKRKYLRFFRCYKHRFWDEGEPERMIIIYEYHNDYNYGYVSLLGSWSFLCLKRTDLEAFEERNDLYVAKDKVVQKAFDEKGDAPESRKKDQVFPFTNPPTDGRQDVIFDLMYCCFADFFSKNDRHLFKKEAWDVVINSVSSEDLPNRLKSKVSLGRESARSVINHSDDKTLDRDAFMARLRGYNKT
ncbi:MAG: hypothetical protein ISEC1_P1590 [Thiomicrorhabdus sp.]|nr:MAG: hypothetical protein ISEC1_P1590 [Thiomicrorhabdus sp.]